jgi:elongator complex protein 3
MLVKVGDKKEGASQHCGVGKNLVKMAEWLAWWNGYEKISVISGEGVRRYYISLGYEYAKGDGRFMVKEFNHLLKNVLIYCFVALVMIVINFSI